MELNNCEKKLIRMGDVNNCIGIMRAATCNGRTLTKERFKFIVKHNYLQPIDKPLPQDLDWKVDKVWDESKDLLRGLKILWTWSDEKIVLRELKAHLEI